MKLRIVKALMIKIDMCWLNKEDLSPQGGKFKPLSDLIGSSSL